MKLKHRHRSQTTTFITAPSHLSNPSTKLSRNPVNMCISHKSLLAIAAILPLITRAAPQGGLPISSIFSSVFSEVASGTFLPPSPSSSATFLPPGPPSASATSYRSSSSSKYCPSSTRTSSVGNAGNTAYVPAPSGGVGVSPNSPPPDYSPASDFDTYSLQLAAYQEFIELDLFHHGLAQFNDSEFDDAGIDASQRYLIQFWAEQEVGHATAINNMLGDEGTVEICNYSYPFNSVREFIDFSQVLTRWGEAGVYGFLPHMDSRPAAQILLQSITTEAKQQEGLAQMEGLFPTPYWFNVSISSLPHPFCIIQLHHHLDGSSPDIRLDPPQPIYYHLPRLQPPYQLQHLSAPLRLESAFSSTQRLQVCRVDQ
jgi:hypothetical protein